MPLPFVSHNSQTMALIVFSHQLTFAIKVSVT